MSSSHFLRVANSFLRIERLNQNKTRSFKSFLYICNEKGPLKSFLKIYLMQKIFMRKVFDTKIYDDDGTCVSLHIS